MTPPPTQNATANATPITDDSVVRLAGRLRLVTTRLARRMRSETEAHPGLTPSLTSALVTVHHHGPLTLGELAERERVAPPTVTKLVGRLETQGLVTREADQEDRRICRVRTTDVGDQVLAESRQRRNEWLAGHLGALDPAELAQLAAALDTLEHLADREPT